MKILVPVDGSDHSYEAVRALAHLSRSEELMLFHALDVPKPAYPMMMPEVAQELYTTMERSMREDGDRLLKRMVALLPSATGPVTSRLEVGSPADLILSIAEERHSDLIVMGARGLGPVKERLFGSVSHRIVTHAPCHAFVVTKPIHRLSKLLLPLQGPEDAEAAVRLLEQRPFRVPPAVTVMTAVPELRPLQPMQESSVAPLMDATRASAQAFVDQVADRLASAGYQAGAVTRVGVPAHAIIEEAAKLQADVIAMGTRGRSGVSRFVLGSVAHAVLHNPPCSILIFK